MSHAKIPAFFSRGNIALQHEVQDKTKKYKLTQNGNEISDQMVQP